MKKLIFLITILFLFAPTAVFAAPDPRPDLKVYYSEPIGAGQRVYHITACRKIPAYGPVVCKQEDVGTKYGTQCDKNEDVGNYIKGCVDPLDGDPIRILGTSYPEVNLPNYARKYPQGCSDKPEKQNYLYGRKYALFDESKLPDVVTPETLLNDSLVSEQVTVKDSNSYTPPTGFIAKEMWQPGLCATWDVIEKTNAPDISPEVQKLIDKIPEAKNTAENLLQQKGCNLSENTSGLSDQPSYTCSLVERIVGKSGTDILGAYIGAIYKWAGGIIGIIAVLTIVYSGIQISVAGGNASQVEESRNQIGKALIALAILFLSGLILYTINPSFFVG